MFLCHSWTHAIASCQFIAAAQPNITGEVKAHFLTLTSNVTGGKQILTERHSNLGPRICQMSRRIVQYELSHEIMALFVLRKLILQTRMRSHPVGLDV